MTLYSKNNLGTLLGLLISIMFGLLCCSSENSAKQQKTANPPSLDTLPNQLGAEAAAALIDQYLDSKNEDVDENFYFDGKMEEAEKVVSFRLNPKQTADFFEELGELQKGTIQPKDSVLIRIRMAFRGKNREKWEKETNLAPLVELIVHDKNPSGNYYPLRPFKSDFIPLFNTLYSDTTKVGFRSIPPSEARALVEKWDSVPVEDITEQLYLDKKTGVPGGRLKYYTFDAKDTEAIYQYQKKLTGKKCYFYIHLGRLEERGYVALRTIIHLDDSPIKKGTMANDKPPYFEFSAPCPNYCN